MVAPSVLRPNRDFNVVVSVHHTTGPTRVGLEITGNVESGGSDGPLTSSFQTRQEAVLLHDSSQLINFQVITRLLNVMITY